jgi:hypothetical protein
MNETTKHDDCRTYAEQLLGLLEVALRQADSLVAVGDEQKRCLGGLCNPILDATVKAQRYIKLRGQMGGAEDETVEVAERDALVRRARQC